MRNIINLEDDEVGHYKCIEVEDLRRLELAEAAAILVCHGLLSLSPQQRPFLNDPKTLVHLLIAKSAKNVRFAAKGLKLGYYSSSSSILRSAFEDLTYASLFHEKPAEVAKLWRNEFASLRCEDRNEFRRSQKGDASNILFDQEQSPHVIGDYMREFVRKANKDVHPSIAGLADEFGLDLEYLVPNELGQAIEESGEDLTEALNRYVLKICFADHLHPAAETKPNTDDELVYVMLTGWYNKQTHSDLVLVAFYIAHRLLDLTGEFGIGDTDFGRGYKRVAQDYEGSVSGCRSS